MSKVTPFLWFNDQAEQAMDFYATVFKDVKIISRSPVVFEIHGQRLMALNGGPYYTLSPAFSLFVDCETQAEVDDYWEKLSAGGKIMQCGWLTDKFGLSWQIVPRVLMDLLADKDRAKANRVQQAMLKMVKLDIKGLQAAADAA
jgi:predicted 3-demethylubiquinone-9 3-methyltransferase (glyoxalase superfamily)